MTLNWSAVAGAGKYNLYFSETPGITTTQRFIPLSSGTTSYTHTNRIGGQTYYYRVAAARLVNGLTEVGSLSNEVSGAAQKSNVVAPVFSTASGFYPTATSLAVGLTSETGGATIYYRTDGQNPDCGGASSTLYSGSFSITSSSTIKAIACYRPAFNDSSITTMTYIVNVGSCGSSSSCYADAKLKSEGFAFISGTTQLIQYGPADPNCSGTSCFKIWREYNGNKFLNASGIWKSGASTWQKKLNSNGERFKDEYAAFPADTLNFEGLRCPVNSFVYQTAPSVMGQCLYYEFAQQSILAIADWNSQSSGAGVSPSFFEGNPDICSAKGMRIPTIVETSISTKPSNNLPSYSETYSGAGGIPSDSNNPSDQNKYFWTATAYGSGVNRFWAWSGNSTRGDVSSTVNYVRCVLPSEPVLFCGQVGNSCYDNSMVKAARNAYVGDGQAIEYVPADSSRLYQFLVWKEKDGSRVLKASGLWNGSNDWQKQLDPPGVKFFADDFNNIGILAGRSCIPSVFLNRSD
ncbi:hypothetical protein EBR96_08950, partial [bacterium]|nr:hypothetical protein [bacterium]